ncbi:MAG TPA: NAD(P)/FAD-dependent oxidoreductase [bacterium]|nr:NAD(P)/FAD-dependent oxidoreductase [bacterium]HPP29551.1 NAD(P)/FAD-dependent oxidoreductase [bacterium]
MEKFDVIVIGAGPGGCMAAIKAAERGKKALLLEKNSEIGRKLLLTGNRRGNITNLEDIDTFITKYRNGQFLRNGFARFFSEDLVEFFESNGLSLKVERGNRVYPESDNAADIVLVLNNLLKRAKVQVYFKKSVSRIIPRDGFFEVITSDRKKYYTDKVVIACGGKSFPSTGSDGSGYKLAERLGHTIIKPVPALCGIEIEKGYLTKRCAGIALKNVRVFAFLNGKKIGEEFGEVLFTHYGFSGPAILNISGDVSENIDKGNIILSINIKPALSSQQLDNRLLREIKENANKQLKNMMRNLLPSGMIDVFLRYTGLDGEKKVNQITSEERKILVECLMSFSFKVKAVRPFEDSMVTRGGVSVKDINPKTMESKIVPGLFFAGEVIDIDGKTGGYNLQAAFTTGYLAGISV